MTTTPLFFGVGRTPLRSFGGLEGEDLERILIGLDVMREVWYGGRPSSGEGALPPSTWQGY